MCNVQGSSFESVEADKSQCHGEVTESCKIRVPISFSHRWGAAGGHGVFRGRCCSLKLKLLFGRGSCLVRTMLAQPHFTSNAKACFLPTSFECPLRILQIPSQTNPTMPTSQPSAASHQVLPQIGIPVHLLSSSKGSSAHPNDQGLEHNQGLLEISSFSGIKLDKSIT